MPQKAWSDKRERQYEHIKESEQERGAGEGRAKEIAARTVNKNRAQSGEAEQASKTSTEDMSPQRRGGKRSGRPGPRGRTKQQLYAEAQKKGIKGRSSMTKKQLEDALGG
ncbi:MAG: plasmid stabilization protein [Streptosporangiaceae bacterium]|nr:plasmid stabilization protein [Streptosporangiaceae bacterium]